MGGHLVAAVAKINALILRAALLVAAGSISAVNHEWIKFPVQVFQAVDKIGDRL